MIRVPLSDYARSEISIRVAVCDEDDSPALRALWDAWDGDRLVVEERHRDLVADGLCELSNACDELSREPSLSADERRANRIASRGLATAMLRVRGRVVVRDGVARRVDRRRA